MIEIITGGLEHGTNEATIRLKMRGKSNQGMAIQCDFIIFFFFFTTYQFQYFYNFRAMKIERLPERRDSPRRSLEIDRNFERNYNRMDQWEPPPVMNSFLTIF